MMLGCCPYRNRISISSDGSFLALSMIWNEGDRVCDVTTWEHGFFSRKQRIRKEELVKYKIKTLKDVVPILYTEPTTSVLKCYSNVGIIIINQIKERNTKKINKFPYFNSIFYTGDSVDAAFAYWIRADADVLFNFISVSEMDVVAMKLLKWKTET